MIEMTARIFRHKEDQEYVEVKILGPWTEPIDEREKIQEKAMEFITKALLGIQLQQFKKIISLTYSAMDFCPEYLEKLQNVTETMERYFRERTSKIEKEIKQRLTQIGEELFESI